MPICDKKGLICSQNIKGNIDSQCLNPCEGTYADIKKLPVEDFKTVPFKSLVTSYSKYSRFNESEYTIPTNLISKFDF